jgi:hypothetical protein
MSDDTRPVTPEARPPSPRRGLRIAIVAAAVIGALAVSLAFAPVRTFAGQVLSIFRVQKIATVSITADDIEKIGKSLENGDAHISLQELGDVWVDGKPGFGSTEPTLTTLSAAQAAVDFPIKVPTGVEGTQSVLLQPGATIKFKLNIDKVNELLRYYGAEKLFSKSLDGKEFAIKVPPTVYLTYGPDKLGFAQSGNVEMMSEEANASLEPDPNSQDAFIVQTRGPELVVPNGVNPLEIRDVLINLPFLPQSMRSQLAGVSDWQSTLLIPNIAGSTREITVNGNPGVVITEPRDPDMSDAEAADAGMTGAAVMWHQDGVLRAVGSKSSAESLKIAESMAR